MTPPPEFDAAQLAAVQSGADRTLVLAVAGSGKSRVIIGHIHWLVEHGVKPHRIAVITYTTAAAAVLVERLGFHVGYAGTLHSWLLRLLNRYGTRIGYSPGIGVVDEEQQLEMLAQVRREQRYRCNGNPFTETPKLDESVEAALRCWDKPSNPTKAENVVIAYRNRLRQNNALDFDGIIHKGKQLVEAMKGSEDWPYTHLLWDEYQDASPDFRAVHDAAPVQKRFAAGDKNQSIFSFLGGDVRNIDAESASGVATVLRLSTNYRCCKAVCRAATAISLAGGSTEQTLPRPDAPEGFVTVTECKDFQAEALHVAQGLRKLTPGQTAAVLLRTNPLVDQYRMALQSYGIPLAERQRPVVAKDWKATRALLALISCPSNDLLAEAFISSIKGPEQAAVSRREAAAKMVSINAHCLHLPTIEAAHEAAAYVAKTKPSAETLARVAAAAALLEPDAGVGELLVALNEPVKAEIVTTGVAVTTFHSAKGLEWSQCWIPACEEGVLPFAKSLKDDAAVDEERRVFYVGITRAAEALHISYCNERQEKFGRFNTVAMEPSRFIREAGLD